MTPSQPLPHPTPCPYCRTELIGTFEATSSSGVPPESGSINLCMSCAGMSVFTDALDLRPLRDAEFKALSDNARERLLRYQRAIRETRAQRN